MENEERKLCHRNEVSRLKDQIFTLESDHVTPMMRDVQSQRDTKRILGMTDQMEILKSKVSSLQNENSKLKVKVGGDSRSSKNDKWRNSALQEQVLYLTQRIRELEGVGDKESVRSSFRDSPRLPRSPTASTSHNNNFIRGDTGNDDISTHTEMTF